MNRAPLVFLVVAGLAACDNLSDPSPGDTPTATTSALATTIHARKELFVTDLAVVRDPKLTTYKAGKWDVAPEGAWSFARLMDNIGPVDHPTDRQRSDFVMHWMLSWETDQVVNDQVLEARPLVRSVLIDPWKQRSIGASPGNTATTCAPGPATDFTCTLGFAPGVVPFQLIAIANRPDLRIVPRSADGHDGMAAQGRFVFMMVDAAQNPLPFTVIFEFMVPVKEPNDIKKYADKWHKLGTNNGPKYKDELQGVTNTFARRDAAPWRQNGSALLQLRTNDVMFAEPGSDPSHPLGVLWELREFVLASDGRLTPDTTKQEPPLELSGTTLLSDWLEDNASAILDGSYVVPPTLDDLPFLAASAITPNDFRWKAPDVDESLRKTFAIGTCNGCHRNETDTFFLHVFPTDPSTPEAQVSAFLAGELAEPDGVRVTDMAWVLDQDWPKIKNGKGKDPGHGPEDPPPPGPRGRR